MRTAASLLAAGVAAVSLFLMPVDSDGAFAAYDGIVYARAAERGEAEPSNFFHPLFHAAVSGLTPALKALRIAHPGHVAIRIVSGLGAVAIALLVALASRPRWIVGLGFAAALVVTRAFVVDAAVGETVIPAYAAALWALKEAARTPVRQARLWLALVLALLLRADSILIVPGVLAGLLAGRDRGWNARRIAPGLLVSAAVTIAAYLAFWWIQTEGRIPIWNWATSYPSIVRNWMGAGGVEPAGFPRHVDALSAAVVGKTWPLDRHELWIGPAVVGALVAAGMLLRGSTRVGPLAWAVAVTVAVRAVFFSWFDAGNPEWSILTLACVALLGAKLAEGEPRTALVARWAGAAVLLAVIAGTLWSHAAFTWRLRGRDFIRAMAHAVEEGRGARVVALGPNVHNALKFLEVEHALLLIAPGSPEALPAVTAELAAHPEPTLIVFERPAPWMVAGVPYLMKNAPAPGTALDDLPPTPGARAIQWEGYTYAVILTGVGSAEMTARVQPIEAQARRAPRLAALVAVVVALGAGRFVPFLDEPWGRDQASGNGAWYSGQPVRNWHRLGFERLRGMELLGALPTNPPVGQPYAHHPPLHNWLVYGIVSTFGFSERSFRILPMVVSALTGGLLVLLVGARCGAVLATLAGILWLTLPMSFFYGVMCNPEAPTVFFMVLTAWLHTRLRTRPVRAYAPALASQFLAGQMDWEGHFLVPALLLYEALLPRGERRFGRVVALGAASLVSAAVAFAFRGFYEVIGRQSFDILRAGGTDLPRFAAGSFFDYLVEGVRAAARTIRATAGASPAGLRDWLQSQGRYATSMFTWPGTVAAGVGVAMAFFRRSEMLALGLALLVPGVLNVVAFRQHAAAHEYWLYYALPGVVVTTIEVARRLPWKPVLAIGLVSAIAAASVHRIATTRSEGRTTEFRDLAAELDRLLEREDEILVCDVRFAATSFYARHWIVAEPVSGRSWEHIDDLAALKKAGFLPRPVTFLIVPMGPELPLDELVRYGPIRAVDAPEVSRRLPTIARAYAGPVWTLTLY